MLIPALLVAALFSFQEPREREVPELERRVAKLEERLRAAKEKGDAEEASLVARELEDVLRRVKQLRTMGPEAEGRGMQEKMAELKRMLAELEAKGDREGAEKVRAQIRDLEARRGPRPGPGGPGPFRDPEQRRREYDELVPVLKELDPGLLERIEALKKEGRHDEAMRLMDEAMVRTRELKDLKERDPEGFKAQQEANALERQAEELGGKLRRIAPERREERDAAKAQLKEVVTKLFDAREKLRNREVEDLKRRVAELQDLLKKRQDSRERIIERRLRQLSGEPDELDW